MPNKIIPYNPKLKVLARQLRKNSTLSEVLLWQSIKQKGYGVQFHRQVPLLEYIVDFYSWDSNFKRVACWNLKAERIPIAERIGINELQLAIEIDGDSHQFKDKYDAKRQKDLEAYGIIFLRFEDGAIKQQMFSVLFVRL